MTLGSHCCLKNPTKKKPQPKPDQFIEKAQYLTIAFIFSRKKSTHFLHTGTPRFEKVTAQIYVQGRKQVQQIFNKIVAIHSSLHLNAYRVAH